MGRGGEISGRKALVSRDVASNGDAQYVGVVIYFGCTVVSPVYERSTEAGRHRMSSSCEVGYPLPEVARAVVISSGSTLRQGPLGTTWSA